MRQKNTIGSTNKVKNTLKQEIYHFYFHFTHILEISRFEVPISRFFWAFLQGLQICTFWRLAGLKVCFTSVSQVVVVTKKLMLERSLIVLSIAAYGS